MGAVRQGRGQPAGGRVASTLNGQHFTISLRVQSAELAKLMSNWHEFEMSSAHMKFKTRTGELPSSSGDIGWMQDFLILWYLHCNAWASGRISCWSGVDGWTLERGGWRKLRDLSTLSAVTPNWPGVPILYSLRPSYHRSWLRTSWDRWMHCTTLPLSIIIHIVGSIFKYSHWLVLESLRT